MSDYDAFYEYLNDNVRNSYSITNYSYLVIAVGDIASVLESKGYRPSFCETDTFGVPVLAFARGRSDKQVRHVRISISKMKLTARLTCYRSGQRKSGREKSMFVDSKTDQPRIKKFIAGIDVF